MISVDRSAVANPFELPLLASRAAEELYRAREQIAAQQFQRRFEFTVYRRPEVKAALTRLFNNKCAYCESPLTNAPGDIEQYRPRSGVSEAPHHYGYWWLANEWSNLLIACQFCNRMTKSEILNQGLTEAVAIGKHNRFPLMDEKMRAHGPEDDLNLEQPLILDPTRDHPESHLIFTDEGLVFSETDRGNVTITVLGLNRLNLVQERARVAADYRGKLRAIREAPAQLYPEDLLARWLDELRDMTGDGAAYAGMVRQFFRHDRSVLQKELEERTRTHGMVPGLETDFPNEALAPVTKARIRRAVAETKGYLKRMANYSLADEAGIERYKSQRRSIETIAVRNIRAIATFKVDLTTQGAGTGRWLMLLGENGTGKSTVLQAIALVLGGSDYVSKLIREERIRLKELVRWRCRYGEIAVKLSGFDAPHRLKVFRDRLEFTSPSAETVTIGSDGKVKGAAWEPQTVMAGYGATRLSRRDGKEKIGGDFARVENLFDPFAPLIDAEAWLTRLKPLEFGRTAIILKDLLGIDPDAQLERDRKQVTVELSGTPTRLSSLSVGYQTVLTATVDMLEIMSRVWQNPLEAEGIALIDELDAHLHPRWQMQIVGSLRKALPGVQFIATTHQPLCLRGLGEGEVVVMRRDEDERIEVVTDLPSPDDFRVDQLLTSPFFGLNSTSDPDTARLFDRYYALLAMDVRNDQDEAELTELKIALEGRQQFGGTQREALYFEAIDKILARRETMPDLPQEEIRADAVAEISAIWERLTPDIAADGRLTPDPAADGEPA